MIETDQMRGGEQAAAWGGAGERIKDRKGFTILELMIVGVVLGILAGIAIPVYLTYLKRAKQVEAPVALTEIKRLESMYFAFSGGYGSLDEIGYHPSTTLRYYRVTLELISPSAGQPSGFKATATGNLDSDPEEDIWTISQDGALQHVQAD
jgi:prepilin-type N-terminal cleavage/methylation domain-containing protein